MRYNPGVAFPAPPDDTRPTPAILIRRLRAQRGWSQKTLAAELGVARQQVIRWEQGVEPSHKYRLQLAALSGEPADRFLVPREARPAERLEERLVSLERAVWRLTEAVQSLAADTSRYARMESIEEQAAAHLLAQAKLLERLAEAAVGLQSVLDGHVGHQG